MKQLTTQIISNKEITAPEIARTAQPGQFMMVHCGDNYDLMLRRPLSIHWVASKEQIAILFHTVGKGSEWLAHCQEGDNLDILGPLGNGFSLKPSTRRLLLIAGGIGIAPLRFLADKALEEELSVTMIMGAQHTLYPRHLLPSQIDLITVTENGSEGMKGMVTDFIANLIPQADQIFACGPSAMYKSIAAQNIRGKLIQVSLEERMGCGVGACYSCTIKTKLGLMQVCRDGPVFELDDILW
jgi:dihydroorotate dehydrogenase electron transfer subunit